MVTGAPRLTRWSNGGVTTLAAAITSAGQLTMEVSSAAPFPTVPDFTLTIGDAEIVLVTDISGTTFTITRGQEGTTAITHLSGTAAKLYNTSGSMDKAFQDGFALPDYPLGRIMKSGLDFPLSSFGNVNFGGATAFDGDDGGVRVVVTASEASNQARIKQDPAPTTPYKITTYCMLGPGMQDFTGADGTWMGPMLRESSTGKLYILAVRGDRIALWRFNSPTSFSAEVDTYIQNNRHAVWLQLHDDGTDVRGFVSFDGYVWDECFNEGRTSFMAGGPNQVGFAVNSGGANAGAEFYFKTWVVD